MPDSRDRAPIAFAIAANGKNTGALHASILNRFGMDVSSYGNPMGSPIAGI